MTDPRANSFVAEHGNESYELDALPPAVLDKLLREHLEELLDREKYDAVVAEEDIDKAEMDKFASQFRQDKEMLR